MCNKFFLFFGLLFYLNAVGQNNINNNVINNSVSPINEKIKIGKIVIKGNKITKDKIILRELEFKKDDIINKYDFKNKIVLSRQNLLNCSLFNFVIITPTKAGNAYNIEIDVVERWYIWPIPIIEFADRNFNVWWETKKFSRLNYGIDLRIENFRGRREYLNFILKKGFDNTITLIWDIPYLNKKQTLGMSFSGGAVFNHETAVNTINNKLQFYKTGTGFVKKWYFAESDIYFRPKYRISHIFSIIYNNETYSDSLLYFNPDFTYGKTKYKYINLQYLFKLDYRDYKPYPLTGYYFDISIKKTGIGLLSKNVNVFTIQSAFDQYLHLYKRWYFAYNVSLRLSTPKHQPYFISSGLGLNRMAIRGYELFIVNGQNIGLYRSNFKYEILPKKTFVIPWIKTQKFGKIFFALYANIFFDAAYVNDTQTPETNRLSNQFLWGTGVGIDFITYYDIVMRVEYAINKQNKTGLYISLVAPI